MNKEEFGKLAAGLRTSYPNQNVLATSEAMDWWYSLLKDLDYQITAQAITKWISTEKFPPTIAEIRKAVTDVMLGQLPDWGNGWMEVKNAISRYGYMNQKDAINSMSEITREVVRRLGWMNLCMSSVDNEQTDRANFRMIYEELTRRKQNEAQTPGYLRELIAKTQESMKPMLTGDDLLGERYLNGN